MTFFFLFGDFCRISEVQDDLKEYVILENAIFVPISAKIGTNLNILRETIITEVLAYQKRENEKEKDEDEKMLHLNDSINNDKKRNSHHINSSSNGVLIDIIKSRKLGTTLHVVIRQGQVNGIEIKCIFAKNNLHLIHILYNIVL